MPKGRGDAENPEHTAQLHAAIIWDPKAGLLNNMLGGWAGRWLKSRAATASGSRKKERESERVSPVCGAYMGSGIGCGT